MTAYEMATGDWSSNVCSSDLREREREREREKERERERERERGKEREREREKSFIVFIPRCTVVKNNTTHASKTPHGEKTDRKRGGGR